MAQATLIDHFGDILKALDEIEQSLPFIVDREELGTAMCQSVELANRVSALQTRLVTLCNANAVAANAGQRTIGQYVAARTNSKAIVVDRLAKTGKWLCDYPILAAAHGVELTDAHVDYLRKVLDTNYDTHVKLKADQQFLVDTAAACSFEGFVQACDYWIAFNDPDGKEPKDQLDDSRFRVGRGRGGRGDLNGTCDAVTAHNLRTAVEHEAEKLRREDKKNGIVRTHSARCMAALAALVERGFERPDGTRPVPYANIVMSLKVAEWALATLRGDIERGDIERGDIERGDIERGDIEPTETVPVHPTNIDGRCELIDGTPIHPFLAVAALGLVGPHGIADPIILRRYVMDADSRILDVSVNARVPPDWMRGSTPCRQRFAIAAAAVKAKDSSVPESWPQQHPKRLSGL